MSFRNSQSEIRNPKFAIRNPKSEIICSFPVSTRGLADCLVQIASWIDQAGGTKFLACANPHSFEMAKHDEVFHAALRNAELLIPDGFGIVLASRILGGAIKERVTGSDIFLGVCDRLQQQKNRSVFFLGSTEENLERIAIKLAQDFPGLRVAGWFSPPFKPEFDETDSERMIDAVNAASPDVLWVGMTAPKQEKWIYLNKDRLNVKFIAAVGAVFDFYVGAVKRSHPWFLDHGLEWLPRLLQQPRRLWDRMLVSAPRFMLRVLREKVKG